MTSRAIDGESSFFHKYGANSKKSNVMAIILAGKCIGRDPFSLTRSSLKRSDSSQMRSVTSGGSRVSNIRLIHRNAKFCVLLGI